MHGMKRLAVVLGALACLAIPWASGQVAGTYVEGEVLVRFRNGVGPAAIQRLGRRHGSKMLSARGSTGIHRFSVPPGRTVAEMVDAFHNESLVEYAEPNVIAQAHATLGVDSDGNGIWVPEDYSFTAQWSFLVQGPGIIYLPQAWYWMQANGLNPGGDSSVVVAVLDTGVAYENLIGKNPRSSYYQAPDLNQTTFVPGWDFINNDAHPNDDHGHGTHVTGTIAQSTDNRDWNVSDDRAHGVAGIAFGVSIMPVKVLDASGSGSHEAIAAGIRYAADYGADIINMSLGGPGSQTLLDAVSYAHGKGLLMVCSAGNEGGAVSYPAAYDDYCLAVSATGYHGNIAAYSNRGPEIDLAAPGGDPDVPTGIYGISNAILQQTFTSSRSSFSLVWKAGTSMAAPHVSGVAALLMSSGVTGRDSVQEALETTARDLGAPGWDDLYGHGLLNAYAALSNPPNSVDVAVSFLNPPGAVLLVQEQPPTPIEVGISNIGLPEPGTVIVELWDGNAKVGESVAVAPTNGVFGAVSFAWTPVTTDGAPRAHLLRASVSAAGDANPGNDAVEASVWVTPYEENIRVVRVDAPTAATVGQPEAIDVLVENQGLIAQDVSVTLSEGGTTVATLTVPGLSPGEQGFCTFQWTPSSAGWCTLTATVPGDENNADNTAGADVDVSTPPDTVYTHVASIGMTLKTVGVVTSATATISVHDDSGQPVAGATVSITWSNAVSATAAAVTGADGKALFTSPSVKKAAKGTTFTITVDGVVKAGTTYRPSLLTSASAVVQ